MNVLPIVGSGLSTGCKYRYLCRTCKDFVLLKKERAAVTKTSPKKTLKEKIELLATAPDGPELNRRYKRVRAFYTPALAAAAVKRAVELNVLMEHASWLVRVWDKMEEDQRKAFAYDAMMRALVLSGQRRRAYALARSSDAKVAQAWTGVLRGILPAKGI